MFRISIAIYWLYFTLFLVGFRLRDTSWHCDRIARYLVHYDRVVKPVLWLEHTLVIISTYTIWCSYSWTSWIQRRFSRWIQGIQYIPRNMHTVFALLCFVVVIHSLIFPYPSGLLHWHCGNLTIAPVSAKQPWWIWINTSCEFIMNDCITTTKQSTTKPCTYFLGYTVHG